MAESQFTPALLKERPVHVVGLGALGSAIVQNLLRMGVGNLHLWDDDVVEARNRFNQRVFEADVGLKKYAAQERIAEMISGGLSKRLTLHSGRADHSSRFTGVVISAVDSMSSRSTIFERVRENGLVSFFADGRIGMDGGKVYGLDPNNLEHVARYMDLLHMHQDPVVVEGACKTEFPMPATADIVAGHVIWRLVRWLHLERGCMDPYDNFIGFYFIPEYTEIKEQWDEVLIETKPKPLRERLTRVLKRLLCR